MRLERLSQYKKAAGNRCGGAALPPPSHAGEWTERRSQSLWQQVPLKKIPKILSDARTLKAAPKVTLLERGHANLSKLSLLARKERTINGTSTEGPLASASKRCSSVFVMQLLSPPPGGAALARPFPVPQPPLAVQSRWPWASAGGRRCRRRRRARSG